MSRLNLSQFRTLTLQDAVVAPVGSTVVVRLVSGESVGSVPVDREGCGTLVLPKVPNDVVEKVMQVGCLVVDVVCNGSSSRSVLAVTPVNGVADVNLVLTVSEVLSNDAGVVGRRGVAEVPQVSSPRCGTLTLQNVPVSEPDSVVEVRLVNGLLVGVQAVADVQSGVVVLHDVPSPVLDKVVEADELVLKVVVGEVGETHVVPFTVVEVVETEVVVNVEPQVESVGVDSKNHEVCGAANAATGALGGSARCWVPSVVE